jgi:hypothetical protein
MSKYISGRADSKNIEAWSNRATANSFQNSDTNKKGGAPNHQTRSNEWFTARDRAHRCAPRTNYPHAEEDLND